MLKRHNHTDYKSKSLSDVSLPGIPSAATPAALAAPVVLRQPRCSPHSETHWSRSRLVDGHIPRSLCQAGEFRVLRLPVSAIPSDWTSRSHATVVLGEVVQ